MSPPEEGPATEADDSAIVSNVFLAGLGLRPAHVAHLQPLPVVRVVQRHHGIHCTHCPIRHSLPRWQPVLGLGKFPEVGPRQEVSCPGTKFHTQIRIFIPRHEFSYPDMTFHTQTWSFIPKHEVSYPDMKFHTQKWSFIHRQEVWLPRVKYNAQLCVSFVYFLCTGYQILLHYLQGTNQHMYLGMKLSTWVPTFEKPTSVKPCRVVALFFHPLSGADWFSIVRSSAQWRACTASAAYGLHLVNPDRERDWGVQVSP
jgi:hypothetical protein